VRKLSGRVKTKVKEDGKNITTMVARPLIARPHRTSTVRWPGN